MPAKRKSGWTKARVRHWAPKWYWVRCGPDDDEPKPCQLWLDIEGVTWSWMPGRVARPWHECAEQRHTVPLDPPEEEEA